MEAAGGIRLASLGQEKFVIGAIEDARKLIGVLNGLLEKSEDPSAKDLTHLIEEKLNNALSQLDKNGQLNKKNEELLQEYLESVRVRTAQSTFYIKKKCIREFIKFLNGKPLAEVDREDFRRFVDDLANKNFRENSIDNFICFNKVFFKYLNRRYGLDIPDFDDIRASGYRGKIPSNFEREPLTREEVRTLIQAAGDVRDRLIIAMLYYTGLRRSELANLRLDDVDTKSGVVRVVRGKGGKNGLTKYKREDIGRLVDLWLERERASFLNAGESPYFIVSKSRGKLCSPQIRQIVHRAAVKARIQEVKGKTADGKLLYKVTPHVLRHSFATHAKEDGMPLDHIQRMMRHENVSTTMIYAKEPYEHLFESYEEKFRGVSTKPSRTFSGVKRHEGGEKT